jgi:drug/metabolite transporter (DMT)-like permease
MSLQYFLLAISTIIWGYGFVAARLSFAAVDPIWSHALRFIVAALISLPLLIYKKSFFKSKQYILKAFLAATFLSATLLFQNIGLNYTTVARSGFITTLYTLFIPLLMMMFFKKSYHYIFWILTLTAIIGMLLLCNLSLNNFNIGDLFTLICAVFAAIHIIYIGEITHQIGSAIEFNFMQIFFVSIEATIIALVIKGPIDFVTAFNGKPKAMFGILFLGILSSMFAFTVQVVAQRKIKPHIAGLIFLLESPIAAFFGYLVFKESMSLMNIIGACLILISVILVPILQNKMTTNV